MRHAARATTLLIAGALVTSGWITPAGAVTSVTACGVLTTAGEVYNVVADNLTACGDCLVVGADRITINLQRNFIVSKCPGGAGVTDLGVPRDGVTVKNGFIVPDDLGLQFRNAINLGASTRTEVRDIYTVLNTGTGIVVGDQSLIVGRYVTGPDTPTTCVSVANGRDGIAGGNRVQVQNCSSFGNAGNGIHVANQCLVTRNIATFNIENGIATGGSCTVTYNTASHNNDHGIDVGNDGEFDGSHSQVTGNVTELNVDDGIHVQCPSTVTNNHSLGNGTDYNLSGSPACFSHGNT